MRSRLPALGALTSAFRPSSSLRPPSLSQFNISVPSIPSCSRWISCSCCRRETVQSTQEYFSANQPRVTVHALKGDEGERKARRIHHLPFPPTLPYSPNSVLFNRQFEILSLYISGATPDQSWDIYQLIHPDIRRDIPDRTFVSLIAHQLGREDLHLCWRRSRGLLLFAFECGMEAKELGKELAEKALAVGLRYSLEDPDAVTERNFHLIGELWRFVKASHHGALGQIPLGTRQGWLNLHLARCTKRVAVKRISDKHQTLRHQDATQALQEMTDGEGLSGLDSTAVQIISADPRRSIDVQFEALQKVVEYWTRGVEAPTSCTLAIMWKLRLAWEKEGYVGLDMLEKEVENVMEGIDNTRLKEYLETCLRQVRLTSQTREERVSDLPEEASASVLVEEGLRLLRYPSRRLETRYTVDVAVSLLARAIRQRNAECNELVERLTMVLYCQSPSGRRSYLVGTLADLLLKANVLQDLDPSTLNILIQLVISQELTDRSYILIRKLYPFARAAETSFLWSQQNLHLWRDLFHYTLSPHRHHLHFASRLYVDLLTDGIPVRRTDALAMIRAIATARGGTRKILLDRHVKDYISMGHGSREALLEALVQGLTTSGRGDDQLTAFDLIMRLTVDKSVPVSVASALLGRIPTSSDGIEFRYFRDLLSKLPPEPDTSACYDTAITTLLTSIHTRFEVGRMSPSAALGRALELYKDMVSRNIPPSSRTVALLIRSLYLADHLDSGLRVFDASMDTGMDIDSHTIGRLMVRFAEEGRSDEAERIGERWIRRHESQDDRGVVGAGVVLDAMRGREIDIGVVAKEGGWAGGMELLRFMETLDTRRDDNSAVATQAKQHLSASLAVAKLKDQWQQRQKALVTSTPTSPISIPSSARRRITWLRNDDHSYLREDEGIGGEEGVDSILAVPDTAGLAGT